MWSELTCAEWWCFKDSETYSLFEIVFIASCGGLTHGYNLAIMAFAANYAEQDLNLQNSYLQGFIISVALVGVMVGSVTGTPLIKSFGRKPIAFLGSGLTFSAGLTTIFTYEPISFILLRGVLGIGLGFIGTVCPLYVIERGPSWEVKTKYSVIFPICIELGTFLSYLAGYGFSVLIKDPKLSWRVMLSGGCVLSCLLMVFIYFFMTESFSHKHSVDVRDIKQIKKKKKSFFLFLIRSNHRNKLTAIILSVAYQLTGITTIIYFSPSFIKMSYMSLTLGLCNFLISLSIIWVRKWNYRKITLAASLVMSVALVLVGLVYQLNFPAHGEWRYAVICAGLILSLAGYQVGIGCWYTSLVGKLFEETYSREGAILTNVLQRLIACLVCTFTLPVFQVENSIIFFVYGGVALCSSIYIFFALPSYHLEEDRDVMFASN